jgi:hypothetical protein
VFWLLLLLLLYEFWIPQLKDADHLPCIREFSSGDLLLRSRIRNLASASNCSPEIITNSIPVGPVGPPAMLQPLVGLPFHVLCAFRHHACPSAGREVHSAWSMYPQAARRSATHTTCLASRYQGSYESSCALMTKIPNSCRRKLPSSPLKTNSKALVV